MKFTGRKMITTAESSVHSGNIISVLEKAIPVFQSNASDIRYLENYRRGEQPILHRKKTVRPEINNKIVVNYAHEIVSFKTGFSMGEPIQYVSTNANSAASLKSINRLNEWMRTSSKAEQDKQLAESFFTCGVGYRIVLANPKYRKGADAPPFLSYVLRPDETFIVYSSRYDHTPLLGVVVTKIDEYNTLYTAYSETQVFEYQNGALLSVGDNPLGMIPIIEYPADNARQGAFEVVMPLLDAINLTVSNRLDGIVQFIQSLLVLKGAELDPAKFEALKDLGGLQIPEGSDILYLVQEMNQEQTQKVIDDMYQTVLNICGMPNRNGGSSTSDTGQAVILRDGWSAAEAAAKNTESTFTAAEMRFLEVVLRISQTALRFPLKVSEVRVQFTRRNYGNQLEKAQILNLMLANGHSHPLLAYEESKLFPDPLRAYTISEEYLKQKQAENEQLLAEEQQAQVEKQKQQIDSGTEADEDV